MPQLGFKSKLLSDQGAHFIPVPADIVEQLGAQKRRLVRVTINGCSYLTSVAVHAGRYFLSVREEVRDAAGIRAGDALTVGLEYEAGVQLEELPDDLRIAIAGDAAIRAAFDALPVDAKRQIVAWVSEARRSATRQRRLTQALRMFGSRRRAR